jgi:hypothetical protein
MTKPVAVFRSRVIGGSRHTVRLDENSHLVLFPTSSRYITSWARYQPHGQRRHLEVDATGRDRVYGWLSIGYHVSGVSRPGRFGHSDPQRTSTADSTGSNWRLLEAHFTLRISRTTGGVGFCPLDRAVGVDPELSLREQTRLVVLFPQHQTDMYGCNVIYYDILAFGPLGQRARSAARGEARSRER